MRIAIVHAGAYPSRSGAEEMAFATASHSLRHGHDVVFAGDERSWRDTRRLPCDIPSFDIKAPWIDTVAEWHPDVIHLVDLVSAEVASQTLRASHVCRAAFVVTPASDVLTWERIEVGRRVLDAADVVTAVTAAEADALRTVAPSIRKLLVSGQAAELPPRGASTNKHRSEPIVLFVGRRVQSKGLWCLVLAMREVRKILVDARLVVVGPKGDDICLDHPDLPSWINDRGLISETEKHQAMDSCDVLCVPTDRDVFPIVFLEAWHHGKPVVTTRFRGAHEVVRDGVDGLVVDRDPSRLAAALIDLLRDRVRMERMGAAGRQRLEDELNWRNVGERMEEAYREAVIIAPERLRAVPIPSRNSNGRAIVLAGGLGSRLSTGTGLPVKPLALIGQFHLIEILLAQLAAQNFERATLCITPATQSLRDVIGDGRRFGFKVDYSHSETLLGTAGSLRLVEDWTEATLVMNGDLLTSFDYRALSRWHNARGHTATVGLVRPEIHVPFAVVTTNAGDGIISLEEKPTLRPLCASGIYVLNPEFLNVLDDQPLDMPNALRRLLDREYFVGGVELTGRWHDVGTPEALRAANTDFAQQEAEFLPTPRFA